jgi:hypothetical protein
VILKIALAFLFVTGAALLKRWLDRPRGPSLREVERRIVKL